MSNDALMAYHMGRLWAQAAAQADKPTPVPRFDPETLRFWKGPHGNAKERRRWRRRNIPNTQREESLSGMHGAIVETAEGQARLTEAMPGLWVETTL